MNRGATAIRHQHRRLAHVEAANRLAAQRKCGPQSPAEGNLAKGSGLRLSKWSTRWAALAYLRVAARLDAGRIRSPAPPRVGASAARTTGPAQATRQQRTPPPTTRLSRHHRRGRCQLPPTMSERSSSAPPTWRSPPPGWPRRSTGHSLATCASSTWASPHDVTAEIGGTEGTSLLLLVLEARTSRPISPYPTPYSLVILLRLTPGVRSSPCRTQSATPRPAVPVRPRDRRHAIHRAAESFVADTIAPPVLLDPSACDPRPAEGRPIADEWYSRQLCPDDNHDDHEYGGDTQSHEHNHGGRGHGGGVPDDCPDVGLRARNDRAHRCTSPGSTIRSPCSYLSDGS
jgi:hypothetical protein